MSKEIREMMKAKLASDFNDYYADRSTRAATATAYARLDAIDAQDEKNAGKMSTRYVGMKGASNNN